MATPCSEFQGARDKDGYGSQRRGGKTHKAHRLALADHLGIPIEHLEGSVLHRCDNPPCVNVEHLFLGSPAENAQDMVAKGRHSGGKKHGATKLSVAQLCGVTIQADALQSFCQTSTVNLLDMIDGPSGSGCGQDMSAAWMGANPSCTPAADADHHPPDTTVQ